LNYFPKALKNKSKELSITQMNKMVLQFSVGQAHYYT